jgi:wyosine [tRNA(Phe)-imidazoG37] synthetase (radical SAM superfamily)
MLGIALLHFIPHVFHQNHSVDRTMQWALGGFLLMFFLQRLFLYHHHHTVENDAYLSRLPCGGAYDCIYCQLGRTTCKTIERKEWVPMDAVLAELKHKLGNRPDYIALSGSGEPTLDSRLDELIDAIQIMTDIPVAVLTNGSLLWQPEVRAQLSSADVFIPSLDAGDELRFHAINRPHSQISFKQMVDGLKTFRRKFRGQYWLEILFLDGYTALQSEVVKLAEWAKQIQPDKVQLNTCVRPPAEEFALMVSIARLKQMAKLFHPFAEVIARKHDSHASAGSQANRDAVLDLLRRRPCTMEDVVAGLGLHPNEASKLVGDLQIRRQVTVRITSGQWHYCAVAETVRCKKRAATPAPRQLIKCKPH